MVVTYSKHIEAAKAAKADTLRTLSWWGRVRYHWEAWRMRRWLHKQGYCPRHFEPYHVGFSQIRICETCLLEQEVRREVKLSESMAALKRGYW